MICIKGKMVFTEEEKTNLYLENEKLVHKVASMFASTCLSMEELHSEALVGFVNALNSFDPDRNTKFSTYAFTCMRKQILTYLRTETKRNKLKTVSLDEMSAVKNDGNLVSQSDVLYYKEIVNNGKELNAIEVGFQVTELQEFLKKELNKMDKTLAQILVLRFGLFETAEHTQQEVADILHTTQSNISKLEKKALDYFVKSTFMEYRASIS